MSQYKASDSKKRRLLQEGKSFVYEDVLNGFRIPSLIAFVFITYFIGIEAFKALARPTSLSTVLNPLLLVLFAMLAISSLILLFLLKKKNYILRNKWKPVTQLNPFSQCKKRIIDCFFVFASTIFFVIIIGIFLWVFASSSFNQQAIYQLSFFLTGFISLFLVLAFLLLHFLSKDYFEELNKMTAYEFRQDLKEQ